MAIQEIAVSRVRSRQMTLEYQLAFPSSTDQRLGAVLQAFSDLVLILDEKGLILSYASGDPSFLDNSLASLLNKRLQDILSVDLARRLESDLRALRHRERIAPFEFPLSLSGRERWFEARLAPNTPSQLILTARDITKYKQTEARMQRQLRQLSALRSIDLAIASGLDLNLLLSMLLDQVASLMHVDAAAILLLNSKTNVLEFTSGVGFHSSTLQYTRLKMGEGCAGRVALERKSLHIPDLTKDHAGFERSPLFPAEHFVAYYGVPLIAKGRVLGVLEVFHRSSLNPDSDWLDFLNLISGQAAIAIDSAMMFREIQKSNLELSLAYDATIEGLSRALDLRDKETEEHTRRVTNITVKLAARLGVGESELVHIRRGAILHDIGKVAIPDRILFKPGPLEEEEWDVMRRHPDIAVKLLSPVNYLAPALDIPHWHHEKWDGTGYPDHLDGEHIPFAARAFALADVYDAMTSDRPYRRARSKQDAIQYIESQSGRHFDPRLVPEFLNMISANGF
jgi:HD-GYP domain-containing protein (c-di-GMP phosphodiesterase class II)